MLRCFDAALGGMNAQAQRGGFGENDLRQALLIFGLGDDAEQRAGAVLLHLQGRKRGIERSGVHQSFERVAQDLRAGIVDIGFDDADQRRFGRGGAVADQDAEDVGVLLEIAIARAVADDGDPHGGQRSEAGSERYGESRAGGRGQFDLGAARVDRFACEQRRGGGRGNGEQAVLGLHGAAADVDRRGSGLLEMSRRSSATQAPTISAMESTAPTSWK